MPSFPSYGFNPAEAARKRANIARKLQRKRDRQAAQDSAARKAKGWDS